MVGTFNHHKLAQLREEKQWSVREVMLYLHDLGYDVSQETIRMWEAGTNDPNAEALPYLVIVFQLKNVDELFTASS